MEALREVGFGKVSRFAFYTLVMVPYRWMLFPPLRVWFLRMLGAHISADAVIHDLRFFNAYRTGFRGLEIGPNCFIGDECLFDLADRIVMSSHVTLAERVTVLTHTNVGYRNHPLQTVLPTMNAPVRFDAGCFVGANVTILPGVIVGECSIVAAGAVVNADVPPRHLVGGVPGRVIKKIAPVSRS